jgi:hypothetical protein
MPPISAACIEYGSSIEAQGAPLAPCPLIQRLPSAGIDATIDQDGLAGKIRVAHQGQDEIGHLFGLAEPAHRHPPRQVTAGAGANVLQRITLNQGRCYHVDGEPVRCQ